MDHTVYYLQPYPGLHISPPVFPGHGPSHSARGSPKTTLHYSTPLYYTYSTPLYYTPYTPTCSQVQVFTYLLQCFQGVDSLTQLGRVMYDLQTFSHLFYQVVPSHPCQSLRQPSPSL